MSARLIEIIRNCIMQAGRGVRGQNTPEEPIEMNPVVEEPQRLKEILDGMSIGTARILIDREASRRISENFKLKGVENKGRYYVARVVRPDGSLIDELLVDKQTGHVQFTKPS